MAVLLGAVAGFLAGRLAWVLLRPVLAQPLFRRPNVRGAMVPTACGIVLPVAVLSVEAGRLVLGAAGVGGRGTTAARVAVLVTVSGMGLLGLFDDLAGTGGERGFRGHGRALAAGRLTSGGAKMAVGGAVAVVAVAVGKPTRARSLGALLADAVLVALAANLGNLVDRAPGRAGKVGLCGMAVLAVASGLDAALSAVAAVLGAMAALLPDDLREHAMLGDTGANVLGAALGLGVVLVAPAPVRALVLAGVAVLNVAGELVSFSRVIDTVGPLRAFDRAGRRAR
jgi:UDP-N-acetylmuramyl pentapeptide phosphotransferase/UDP-N-acetylglucosamine-1-phosphate transferase